MDTISVLIAVPLLIKTTAAQNKAALRYDRVRGLYFLPAIFVAVCVRIATRYYCCVFYPYCWSPTSRSKAITKDKESYLERPEDHYH